MLFDEAGTAVKLFGTDQDITEKKQAEEELRRAKDLYQRIVETTREGILILDPEDRITFVNPSMAQILGYSVDTMTGMPAKSLVDEETHALLRGHQKQRFEGLSEHYETQLLTKDGAVVHVVISASPFMGDDGRYGGALAWSPTSPPCEKPKRSCAHRACACKRRWTRRACARSRPRPEPRPAP